MEQGQLDIEDACRGFLDLAKAACAGVCGSIFSDPAFAELFHRMYCSDEWQRGDLTGTVLATLEDYLEEYEHYILPAFFKRCGRVPESCFGIFGESDSVCHS